MKKYFDLSFEEINSLYPVINILLECGATKLKDKGDYYSFSSPFREDRNPSMVLYKDNLTCIDFAGDFKGSLFSLVKKCLGLNLYDLIGATKEEVLNKKYFGGIKQSKREEFLKNLSLEDYEVYIKEGKIQYDFTKNKEAQDYIESRFIDEEFQYFFNIGYTWYCRIHRAPKEKANSEFLKGTHYNKRICIPIYYENCLVSIEGRDWTRKSDKKIIYPKGGSSSYLFNYDNLDKTKPLIIVEGIMDVPRIWSNISKNVTCIYGNQYTLKQRKQLLEFPSIILFGDGDKGGRQLITNTDKFYNKEFDVALLESGDPGDSFNSLDDIKRALDEKKPVTEFYLEESGLFSSTNIKSKDFFCFN